MNPVSPSESAELLEESKCIRRVNKVIDQTIRECLLVDKSVDIDAVYDRIISSCAQLLKSLWAVLGRNYLRIMIQHKLKRVPAISPEEAAERAQEAAEQPDLPGMEQFRNVPQQVSLRLPDGRVTYIPYGATLEWQRAAALELLGKSIAADTRSYHAIRSGNEFASALAGRYGDVELYELVRLWKRDGCPKVA